ncbi:YjbF family lipoprotein [Roseomonas sp. KE0001]|uniref:YjbF family lipoprotein n=1 Tax=Roseomonas sp. KE0001 TaxID=2479201 RepID=UPI0018E0035E|nr:YjbF family lipoprotein [Roseomonas sp. KE0001]MBI0433491.1 hypothetical protein [Roseomonas sp. KE0001]
MRLLPRLGLLLLLPGCAGLPVPDWADPSSLWQTLWEAPPPEAEADAPQPGFAPPPDGAPALGLTWQGRRALARLVQQNGENRLWRSAGGLVVATDGARVVATAGLREWIAGSRLDGPDPLDEPLAIPARPVGLRRQIDLMRNSRKPDEMRFGLSLTCRVSAGPAGAALLIREGCRGGGHSFTNRYWADPATGGIYRSEQWVGEAGMMLLEVVTPPSS